MFLRWKIIFGQIKLWKNVFLASFENEKCFSHIVSRRNRISRRKTNYTTFGGCISPNGQILVDVFIHQKSKILLKKSTQTKEKSNFCRIWWMRHPPVTVFRWCTLWYRWVCWLNGLVALLLFYYSDTSTSRRLSHSLMDDPASSTGSTHPR